MKLTPQSASMSSQLGGQWRGVLTASRCIDGLLSHNSSNNHKGPQSSMCFTKHESAPWLAINLQQEASVQFVKIYNSKFGILHNLEVRIFDRLKTNF